MQWVSDLDVKGKRVLVRADFNVPVTHNGDIADDFRIQATLPTLQHILSSQGKVIVMSHFEDAQGKALSMGKVADRLAQLLGVVVKKATDCMGKDVQEHAHALKEGDVLVLENLRFHKEEEENSRQFAKELAQLGDVCVVDAFGVMHRDHASVSQVPLLLPSAGGLLLQKEIAGLQRLLKNPEHPMVAIVGGQKIESKLPVIDRIAEFADQVLLGNLLANEIVQKNIVLQHKDKVVFPPDGVPKSKEYDIGPETTKLYQERIREAKTIFWSGPLGRYEEEQYTKGSRAVAEAIVEQASYAVAGGGNLLDFLGRYGLRDKFDHISTGGGSMLAFLAGQQLPGLKALGYYD